MGRAAGMARARPGRCGRRRAAGRCAARWRRRSRRRRAIVGATVRCGASGAVRNSSIDSTRPDWTSSKNEMPSRSVRSAANWRMAETPACESIGAAPSGTAALSVEQRLDGHLAARPRSWRAWASRRHRRAKGCRPRRPHGSGRRATRELRRWRLSAVAPLPPVLLPLSARRASARHGGGLGARARPRGVRGGASPSGYGRPRGGVPSSGRLGGTQRALRARASGGGGGGGARARREARGRGERRRVRPLLAKRRDRMEDALA